MERMGSARSMIQRSKLIWLNPRRTRLGIIQKRYSRWFPYTSLKIHKIFPLPVIHFRRLSMEKNNGEVKEEFKAPFDGSICGFYSLHRLLKENLKPQHFQEVSRLLLGLNCGRALDTLTLPESAIAISLEHGFDLQAFSFHANRELMREPRIVGLIQNSIALPTIAPFLDQKKGIFEKIKPIIDAAGAS